MSKLFYHRRTLFHIRRIKRPIESKLGKILWSEFNKTYDIKAARHSKDIKRLAGWNTKDMLEAEIDMSI